MPNKPPKFTGKELLKLFKKDGWQECRRTTHGVFLFKEINGEKRIVMISPKDFSIPDSIMGQILGPKQSGIGKEGLLEMIERHR